MSTPSLRTRSFFTIAGVVVFDCSAPGDRDCAYDFLIEGDTSNHRVGDPAITDVFYISVTGLSLAVASLFGIRQHGMRSILWKAVAGIIASSLCGLYAALGLWSRIADQ